MRSWVVFITGVFVGGGGVATWVGLRDGAAATLDAPGPADPATSADGSNAPLAAGPSDRSAPTPGPAPREGLAGLDRGVAPLTDEAEFLRAALAEERRRRAAARIRPEDTGLDVLRRVTEERGDPTESMADFDRFAARVRPARGTVARIEAPMWVPEILGRGFRKFWAAPRW